MDFCTASRAEARLRNDENESDFFKLCANACYGRNAEIYFWRN